jgi:hypothetical protein
VAGTDEKPQIIPTEAVRSDSEDEAPLIRTQPTMTKAKWLACVALCLCFTTAFQQNACTSAIVKHIDAELGIGFRTGEWQKQNRADLILKAQHHTITGFLRLILFRLLLLFRYPVVSPIYSDDGRSSSWDVASRSAAP